MSSRPPDPDWKLLLHVRTAELVTHSTQEPQTRYRTSIVRYQQNVVIFRLFGKGSGSAA